ncbi:LamG-like jellyroll fold domain-containing protein [Marinoscillum pacificum]|uniref:LamG-like jellyroll fold domain-containing protein n=1 Tax=Marinoscillum pacificum TaxID=392723 RepID=UPI0021587389|nr:LamG-like jellyroll fold domain-containing protein [Marinoscillum pacificum]
MKRALLISLLIIYSLLSYSQVRINCETGDLSGTQYTETIYQNTYVYQTFTPCESGTLTSIRFGITNAPSSMSYAILDADNNAAVLHSNTYTNAFNGDNTLNLTSANIQVTAGNTYTIRLGSTTSFFRVTRFNSDVYAGGSMFVGTDLKAYDMRFMATVATDIYPNANDEYAQYSFTAGSLEDEIEAFSSEYSDIINEGSSATADRFGGTNNARSFSYGNTAYIPHYLLDITSDFTINTWFKLVNLDNANPKYILDSRHGLNGTEQGGISIMLSETKELKVQAFKTAGGFANTMDLNTEFPVNDDWYMMSLVNSGGTLTVYLDGIAIGSGTPTTLENGERWNLGYIAQASNNTGLRREFPGYLDDIKFVQRALTTTEINTLFSEGGFSKSWGPTSVSLTNSQIDENEAIGTVVGTLGSTSLESGETYTYTVSGTDAAYFTVANGNELQLASALDFETQSSHEIEITASDASGNSFTQSYTITVNDEVELGPNDEYAKYSFTNGSYADEINAFDRSLDATGNSSFDTDRFGFANNALQIATGQFASVADTIINIEKDFSINLWFQLENSVSTELKYLLDSRHDFNGVEVGGLSVLLKGNNELAVQTFKTTGGFANTLDLNTGEIITVDGWHMVTVTASSGLINVYLDGTSVDTGTPSVIQNGLNWAFGHIGQSSTYAHLRRELPGDLDDVSFFQRVLTQAEITDFFNETAANVAPSDISLSASSLDENVTVGTSVATLSTTDINVDDTHTYTISGTDAAFFDISGSDLVTSDEIDFETQNSFEITITTTDNHGATYDKAFTITANDVNEAPTAIAIDYDQVYENMAAGEYIGDLSATDVDADDTFTFTTTSTDFTIDGVELLTAVTFDYETATTADVEITVTDSQGATYTETMTINIQDVDYPQVVQQLPDVLVAPDFGTYTIDLSGYFFHDNGLALTYQAYVQYDSIATAAISGSELVITEVAEGITGITVLASDPNEATTSEKAGSFTFSIADISSNLVAYYPSPDGVDASGSDNDATPNNVTSVEDRFGNSGEAYDFNGSSSIMSLPNSILVKDEISISLWFKTSDFGGILGYQNTSTQSNPSSYVPVITIDDPDGDLYSAFWQSQTSAMPAGNHSDNKWHHLVLTGTAGAQTIYIDNELLNTSTSYTKIALQVSQLGAAFTGGNWTIGNGGWFYYDGALDDVRIYERVLSATQVAALYNMSEPGTPEVVSPIADIALDEDAEPQTLVANLSRVFSNPNASAISYEITHDLGTDVSLVLNGSAVELEEMTANFNGAGTVTVSATLADTTMTDEFVLTINSVNDAPAFSLSESEIVASINFTETKTITATPEEVPADEVNQAVVYSIAPTSSSVATVSIDATTGAVSFTSIAGAIGTETFTVTANDGQATNNTATATFTFSVVDNQAPVVANSITDAAVDEDGTIELTNSLSAVFTDSDGDELTYTVSSDTSAVVPAIDGDILAVTLASNYNGVAIITLTATDGQQSASDEITLTVNAINDAPTVANTVDNQTTTEGLTFSMTLSTDLFTDVDGDEVSISEVSITQEWLVYNAETGELSGTPSQENVGSTTVTVTGSDGELVASTDFTVEVENVNDAPVVSNELSAATDKNVTLEVDLTTIFSDQDGDELTFSISSNESESLFTASIEGATLNIVPVANQFGTGSIEISACDASENVTYTLLVEVLDVNALPELISEPTVSMNEDGVAQTVDLSTVFSDPDGDEVLFSIIVDEASSAIFTVGIDSHVLTITPNTDAHGSGVIQIIAFDELGAEQGTSYDMPVTVVSVNDAPIFTLDVSEFDLDHNFSSTETATISLDVPANESEEVVTFSITPAASSIVNVSIDGTNIAISAINGASGTEVFTITANDGQSENAIYEQTLTVTVAEDEEDKVILSATTNDLKVYPNPASSTIEITGTEGNFTLIDINGQIILNGTSNQKNDISGLAEGIYFIRIKSNDGIQTKKLIIKH